jgi:hypothetical protein
VGSKEPSDGIKYLDGTLYWGALTISTFYSLSINSSSTFSSLTEAADSAPVDEQSMHWIDTFAIDLATINNSITIGDRKGKKKIWFVSNRLDLYSVYTMDFSGNSGANMRIMSFEI